MIGKIRFLGIAFTLALLCACASSPRSLLDPPAGRWPGGTRVRVSQGILQGFRDSPGVLSWLGVPYAEAPLRSLRWLGPRPHAPWTGARPARRPGSLAVQLMPLARRGIGTEDCLHLNLWRPDDRREGLPVYVWIHGGANTSGYSMPEGDYKGATLARESGFLVVSLNYRLGPLGWLMDKDLAPDAPGGNLGLMDIIAALRWIKENAPSFGGDPAKITVAGESAGAANILALLLCGRATGLFNRAILQSPLDLFSTPARARKEAFQVLCRVLVGAGKAPDMGAAAGLLDAMEPAEKAAFFRSRKASEFLAGIVPDALGMYDWPSLVLDGDLLLAEGLEAFAAGSNPVKVPLILGSNRDEVGVFLYLSGLLPLGVNGYYRSLAWGSATWATWVEGLASRLASAPGQPPVHLYRFDWGGLDDSGRSPLPGYFGNWLGAFHSLEIPFFLGNDTVAGRVLTGLLFNPWNQLGRQALSGAIRSYTASFARGQEMDGGSELIPWPPFPPVLQAALDGQAPARGLRFGGDAFRALVRPLDGPSAQAGLEALEADLSPGEVVELLSLLPAYLHRTLAPR